jgi:hypothetical protein
MLICGNFGSQSDLQLEVNSSNKGMANTLDAIQDGGD